MSFIRPICIGLAALFFSACSTTLDPDIVPVENFKTDRYLGKWYEIARIENRFEKDLTQVTAEYTRRDDAGIKVVNRGYNAKKQKWNEATGKAFFVENENTGYLKVSFFGPFYGPYVIFELDEDYQYSFVTNHNKKYLWLLARTPEVSEAVKDKFMSRIHQMGFETQNLIWVDQ